MSASTERKRRQAAREAGTDKKMLAQQEEAQKKAKSKIRWTWGTIGVVLLIAAILFLNSGILYSTTTALTIGDTKYSPAEMNYYYGTAYYNMANQYGSYASLLGLDTSAGIAGLKHQSCPMLEDGGSWKDYFLDTAKEDMVQIKALTDYAAQNGLALTQEEIDQVDSGFEGVDDYAKTMGYANANAFFAANYGNGVNQTIVRQAMLDNLLANNAYVHASDSFQYDAAALEAAYQGLNGAQDVFQLALYHVVAETVETPSETEGEDPTTAPTEQTLAEAKATADAIAAGYRDGDEQDFTARLNAAIDHEIAGEEATVRTNATGSSLAEPYKEWMLDASRKAGDLIVTDDGNNTGSYVVLFLSRSDNHYPMAQVRHILIKAEASEDGSYSDEAKAAAKARAEEILAQWQAGDKTEESFAALAEEFSEDTGSNTNGGLYDSVAMGQMVPEFDAFCFGGHKSGDTAIVYGESGSYAGYHVMYYVGEGDLYSNYIARSVLLNDDLSAWLDELLAGYEAVPGFGYRMVG